MAVDYLTNIKIMAEHSVFYYPMLDTRSQHPNVPERSERSEFGGDPDPATWPKFHVRASDLQRGEYWACKKHHLIGRTDGELVERAWASLDPGHLPPTLKM